MTTSPSLRLAAACIPIRERAGAIEVLMVRRNPELSFGGFWTFPGGVLEPSDGVLPEAIDEDTQNWAAPQLLAAAGNGAARETVEETALRCDVGSLAWFSHWIPPKIGPPKRFATWFFLAPEFGGELVVDTAENDEARWTRPDAALAACDDGTFPLAVPTWITVDDLAEFDSVAQLMDHTITQGARMHHTRAMKGDGDRIVCWEGDAAYDNGIADTPGARNRAHANADFKIVKRIRST